VGKASSAKKVARVAKSGKGAKVRSGQGQVFYTALAIVAVLGLALIVYARQSGESTRVASPPTLSDHWHSAYGVYVCGDGFLPPVTVQDDPVGIHSHADGLIHIHPFSSEATGSNAKLGVFLDATGIKLSSDKLELPNDGGTWETPFDCPDGGTVNTMRVAYWANANDTGDPIIYTSEFDDIRFTQDGGAYIIAAVPDDFDFAGLNAQLPSIAALAAPVDVAASDTPAPTDPTATTVEGETTTTAPGATAPTTTAPAASEPATTAAPTTTSG
jgi:hypothetical protein